MGVKKGYRKATSKRFLREQYQAILAVTPVDDPKYLTTVRLLARLEGHDTKTKLGGTDYPDRHKKKGAVESEPEPAAAPDDGDEPLSDELQARTDEYLKASRAWEALSANKPLPEDAPDVVRAVSLSRQSRGRTPAEFQLKGTAHAK